MHFLTFSGKHSLTRVADSFEGQPPELFTTALLMASKEEETPIQLLGKVSNLVNSFA